MRNYQLSHVVFVLGILVLAVPATYTEPLADGKIEAAVIEELAASSDGTSYVIVMLRRNVAEAADLTAVRPAVQATQQRVLTQVDPSGFLPVYQYQNFFAMTGHVDANGLAQLATHPDVVGIGVDARGQGHLNVSVPFIGADTAQAMGYTGSGITVAVLDTGIDSDHPDLSDNIASGWYHFLNQGGNVGPGAEDDNGHGTNVSGIITSKGVVAPIGVAPDTDILAIKVLDSSSSGWVSDWVAGVDYVVANQTAHFPLAAINMSLGTFSLFSECPCDNEDFWTQALHASIQAAKTAGIPTFASSGNNGSCSSMSSPACLSSAVAVAAVYDQNLGREPNSGTYQSNFGSSWPACFDDPTFGDLVTCFSNRSLCNELAAPGRAITAPGLGGGTSTFTGTSQAAPHCTGVAALMWQKCSEAFVSLPATDLIQTLHSTGVPTTDPCGGAVNPVRIDAVAAVNATCITDCNNNGIDDALDLANCDGSDWCLDCNNNGTIDECDGICHGDANCDNQVDFGDINGFVAALVNGIYCDGTGLNCDMSCNGSVGFEDINPFVAVLTTNPLPVACP